MSADSDTARFLNRVADMLSQTDGDRPENESIWALKCRELARTLDQDGDVLFVRISADRLARAMNGDVRVAPLAHLVTKAQAIIDHLGTLYRHVSLFKISEWEKKPETSDREVLFPDDAAGIEARAGRERPPEEQRFGAALTSTMRESEI